MISDVHLDLSAPNMPIFILIYATDAQPAVFKRMAAGKRLYLGQVLMTHNPAGREIPNAVTVHNAMLPV